MPDRRTTEALIGATDQLFGLQLQRPQLNNLVCIFQAAMAAWQCYQATYNACVNPAPPPPSTGYDPGNRPRC